MADRTSLKTILSPLPSQNGFLDSDIGKITLDSTPFFQ